MRHLLPHAAFVLGLMPSLGVGQPTGAPVIAHAMEVRLDPEAGEIQVRDRLGLPEGRTTWELILHRDLNPRVVAGGASLLRVSRDGHLERLRLTLQTPGPVTLAYGGRIRHGLDTATEGMGRDRQSTLGTIGPEGVFLDGRSGWYPQVPGSLQTFDLQVTAPPGWQALSQGAGPDREGHQGSAWVESQPQDEIYLVAAPFTLYREPGPGFEAQVWLRRPDQGLATAYLAATLEYVELYSQLIGPYPYAKFALVENFWETGYGMPSFTLLGPQVIRLPFIIRTSYPHEVLHNWWGNGVYVDYESGNWSEGLTAYLADHLMKEREGLGAEYRRDALKAYGDYVSGAADFPLTAFLARHGAASQAIGYGKAAMVFHMLRRQLGDALFLEGLGRFYQDNRFRTASWADVRAAFESASGQDLGDYFDAWTTRKGAPRLGLSAVRADPSGAGFRVSGRLEQTQPGAPFPLRVPLVVHQEQAPPVTFTVDLDEGSAPFSLDLPSAPIRVAVDPSYDTFRELLPGESPAALSNLFGAEKGLILVPAQASPPLLEGYRALAGAWTQDHPGWEIKTDAQLDRLPEGGALWILGWENRFVPELSRESRGYQLDPAKQELRLGGRTFSRSDSSAVLTRMIDGRPWGWVAAAQPEALPGLTRKLPHYGRYGYLVFAGEEPQNILKGQWPPGDSALVHWFDPARPELPVVPDRPLVPLRGESGQASSPWAPQHSLGTSRPSPPAA